MSTGVVTGERLRVAISVAVLAIGVVLAGFVVASASVRNTVTIAGIGLVYVLVLTGLVDRTARPDDHGATWVVVLVLSLFVLLLALMTSLPETNQVEGGLLFLGIAVIPGAGLELYRILADR